MDWQLVTLVGFFIMVATPKLDDWLHQQGNFVFLAFIGFIMFLTGVINLYII